MVSLLVENMVLLTIQTIICNLKYHSEIPKIGKSVLIHLTVVYTGCSEKHGNIFVIIFRI